MIDELVKQFDQERRGYEAFTLKLRELVSEILNAHKVAVHSITGRTKTRESFGAKVRTDPKYKSLADVTDICGIRIITYFADDVDKVAAVILGAFDIHSSKSGVKHSRL